MTDKQIGVWTLTTACPTCRTGSLVARRSVTNGGLFCGCSRYPACNHTSAYDDGLQVLVDHINDLEKQIALLLQRKTPVPRYLVRPTYLQLVK